MHTVKCILRTLMPNQIMLLAYHLCTSVRKIPAKLWIFVFDSQRLISVIQQVDRPDDDAQQICHFIHLHKNLFFSLPFLEHHNIPDTTFYQYFGNSVFVQIGVFHQVINVSPNPAEAINFGSDIWNLVAPHLSSCRCEGVPYSLISPNPDLDVVLTSSQLPAYPCQEPNCDFTSRTYSRFLEHIRTAHARGRPALPANRMWCLACDKSVAVQRVAEHIATLTHRGQYLHSQKIFPESSRRILSKFYLTDNMVNLPAGYDNGPGYGVMRCQYCHRYFLGVQHSHHEKRCLTKPFYCAHCDLTFVTRSGLERHIRGTHAGVNLLSGIRLSFLFPRQDLHYTLLFCSCCAARSFSW
ncbi:hypothetical protein QAD02_007240 [Eretmocerus hayati]|uniref:Uncharacterized protein n=1 Tax=Eretmocerus hayati TaxID=131215 RepID=A0ACC2N3N6_9HYME|nr:hypothetical protein QAD02_007240 [Eretmocerus hayati]